MKINTPLVKVLARYGVLAALFGIALVVVLFYADKHPFLIPVYADFRIFLFAVFIFFGLKEVRDQHQQGILYFWQGMVGSYVFLVSFALLAALGIGILAAVDDSFVKEFVRLFTEQARNIPAEEIERVGKENFDRNLEALSDTNSFELVKLHVKQSLMIGFFISIIITIILRKQPKL